MSECFENFKKEVMPILEKAQIEFKEKFPKYLFHSAPEECSVYLSASFPNAPHNLPDGIVLTITLKTNKQEFDADILWEGIDETMDMGMYEDGFESGNELPATRENFDRLYHDIPHLLNAFEAALKRNPPRPVKKGS